MYNDLKVMAELCANKYNASTETERKHWKKNALHGIKGTRNTQVMWKFMWDHKYVFRVETDSIGISHYDLTGLMTMVYAAETNLGRYNKMSSTGVVGALQVTTNTFRDLVHQGILGNKAAKVLGFKDRLELQTLSNTKVRRLLRTNRGSFLAGTAKMLQILMESKRNG